MNRFAEVTLNWKPWGPALPEPIGSICEVNMCKFDGRYFICVPIIATEVSPDPSAPPQIYVILAESMEGPWSEPINLGISGNIDRGHVVGEDGRRYLFLSGVSLSGCVPTAWPQAVPCAKPHPPQMSRTYAWSTTYASPELPVPRCG